MFDEIIARETTPRFTHFWGADVQIAPALVSQIFGDGQALMYFTPMDTRPNYYLVRVDSSLTTSDDVVGFIDSTLMDAIEDEFGSHERDQDDYPALNCECGYSWCFEE